MIDMMVRGLELSDAQKAKLEELTKEQGPKLREAFEKMSSFLTDEQKKAREEQQGAAPVPQRRLDGGRCDAEKGRAGQHRG